MIASTNTQEEAASSSPADQERKRWTRFGSYVVAGAKDVGNALLQAGKSNYVKAQIAKVPEISIAPSEDFASLYADLYEHESQMREAISSRLQVPLAIGVSLASVLGFLFSRRTFLPHQAG